MRHTLSRIHAVLDGDIQTTRAVDALDHCTHAPHGEEEVACFGRGEVGDSGHDAERGDQDVAGEDWFEVYEGEGLGGLVEDLVVVSSWYECFLSHWDSGVVPGRLLERDRNRSGRL